MPPSTTTELPTQHYLEGSQSHIMSVQSPTKSVLRRHGRTKASTTESCRNKDAVTNEHKDYVYTKVTSDHDFMTVCRSLSLAQESCWYYGDCTSSDAKALLKQTAVGTFIMRNSSDPKFLFSMSVKTERGPTSVRIKYSRGLFQMDCEEHLKQKLPKFDNVVELVNFHSNLSKSKAFSDCRWLEKSGRRDMSVTLHQPRRNQVPSLQHMCRLTVNSTLTDLHFPQRSTQKLPVPGSIKRYLEDYPYTL